MERFITQFSPTSGAVAENPARFTWPMLDGASEYTHELCTSPDFCGDVRRVQTCWNFYTPDYVLAPGQYFWRVNGGETHSFNALACEKPSPLPTPDARYVSADSSHPRLWQNPKKLEDLRKRVAADPNYVGYADFCKYSVHPRVQAGFPAEPPRYPNDVRVVDLWRKNYMDCQQALCYVRSLAIAGVMGEDAELIALAKSALLKLASWDYSQETSSTTRLYNDECAYRVGYALAYGYDWLFEHLDKDERELVFNTLFARTKEVADYAIYEKKIHNFPYDSHAVRSLSMMIIPCTIAMLDLESADPQQCEIRMWLDYAIEYLSAVYTPWGGADGGWAEGPLYWTTGMAFVTEALMFLKNYTGVDLLQRPFFQNTGDFMLCCNPPNTYYATFCDQSNQGQPPGPKAAFNMRLFARLTGRADFEWYAEQVMARSEMAPEHFSEKGWWDLYYDALVLGTNFDGVAPAAPPQGITAKHFSDIGWAAVSNNLCDPARHVFFLMKSSPFGSLSHSHADQNSFVLFAYGKPLIINSGTYVGYGTQMHLNWRKQTKSANTILIDGLGQFSGRNYAEHKAARAKSQDITAGDEKVAQLSAKGEIVTFSQTQDLVYIKADATAAYLQNVPYLLRYVREFFYYKNDRIVIRDIVTLAQDARISVLFHALVPFEVSGIGFLLINDGVELRADVDGDILGITQTDTFEGVDERELVGADKQYHLAVHTRAAASHVVTTTLKVHASHLA